jgi:CDP-diacylglycerol--glycerol-3-phosphate 3-phosphatidyltransferase
MPTDSAQTPASNAAHSLGRDSLNLPNLITVSRLLLSVVLFALIDIGGWWITSALLFAFAAATDALDGYLARKNGQVTVIGRILDPFADKIIVGGTFLFLLAAGDGLDSGVNAWMVIIVLGREMFISSLRGFLEQAGKDFSASISGKIKMATQCLAVTVCLVSLSPDIQWDGMVLFRDSLLWLAVAATVWSGAVYIVRAIQLLGLADEN